MEEKGFPQDNGKQTAAEQNTIERKAEFAN